MLSIGKVSAGKAMYYEDSVARSQEDYVSLQGEARGQWFGRGAEALELHGEIEDGQLSVLVSGRDPGHPDQELGHRWAAEKWGAYDLTFSAPKSVSVLYALAPPEVQAAMVRAHDEAVRGALGYMEDTSCFGTRGSQSQGTGHQVQGDGFVAGLYRHRVARPVTAEGEVRLDPQLHTHCIVANRTRGAEDGRWTAIDMSPVYRNARTGGYTYQGELRRLLTEQLGVEWDPVEKGQADIAIPDFEQLKAAFSSRREVLREAVTEEARRLMVEADVMTPEEAAAAIDADTAMTMLGSDGMRTATLATREVKGKGGEGSERDLRLSWAQRAAGLGVTEEQLLEPIGRTAAAPGFEPDLPRELLLDELTERQSTFTRHDLVRALHQHAPQGAHRDQVDRAVEEILAEPRLVRRMPVRDRQGEERFSTPAVQDAEVALVDGVRALARVVGEAIPAEVVEQVLAERPELSTENAEQADFVRQLARREAGIASVIGPGGSGKTHAFGAYAEASRRTDRHVVGAAFTGAAALNLERDIEAPSFTIHRLLGGREGWRRQPMPAGTTVIVDEASMVGREHFAELVRLATRDRAMLVLGGDDHQLPSMDAGGPFRAIHAFVPDGNRVTFTSNRRQRDLEERRLLALVRDGESAGAIRGYLERGQIVKTPDAVATRLRMIDDWFAAHQSRDEQGSAPSTLLLGHRKVDVALLNDLARQRCVEAGLVGGPEVRHEGRTYQAGDRVMCLRNRYADLNVRNGQRGDVVEVDASGRRLRVSFDQGEEKWLPLDRYPHVDHGWAMTVQKAQGQTADHIFVMRPGASGSEWHYTALSRGREPVRYYMVDRHLQADVEGTSHAGEREETRTIDDVLAAQWARSEAGDLTLDYHAPTAAPAPELRAVPEVPHRSGADPHAAETPSPPDAEVAAEPEAGDPIPDRTEEVTEPRRAAGDAPHPGSTADASAPAPSEAHAGPTGERSSARELADTDGVDEAGHVVSVAERHDGSSLPIEEHAESTPDSTDHASGVDADQPDGEPGAPAPREAAASEVRETADDQPAAIDRDEVEIQARDEAALDERVRQEADDAEAEMEALVVGAAADEPDHAQIGEREPEADASSHPGFCEEMEAGFAEPDLDL